MLSKGCFATIDCQDKDYYKLACNGLSKNMHVSINGLRNEKTGYKSFLLVYFKNNNNGFLQSSLCLFQL